MEAPRRHPRNPGAPKETYRPPRDTQEIPRRHTRSNPGDTQGHPRIYRTTQGHTGDTKEAPQEHPGDIPPERPGTPPKPIPELDPKHKE